MAPSKVTTTSEPTRSSSRRTSTSSINTTTSSPKPTASTSTKNKRVRVTEPEVPTTTTTVESVTPSAVKKGKRVSIGGEQKSKDLVDKKLNEIDVIISSEVPAPTKGVLKKTAPVTTVPVVVVKEKKSKKEVVSLIEPEEEEELEGEDGEDEEEGEGEIDFLKGFESDGGEDSSDDEEMNGEGGDESFDIKNLPSIKDEAAIQRKLEEKAERKKNAKTGTIYLGRIPHGFHEAEMKSYFSQFGEISRLRLSRNKNSGASKHYAFIEFAYASVAVIVQETMDNYLLSGHILVCKIVPDDEIHPKLWIGANRKFRPVPKGRRDRIRREAPKTDEQKVAIKKRILSRENAKRTKLAALGIDYNFPGHAAKPVERIEEPVKEVKGKKEKKEKKEKKDKIEEPAKKKARKSM